MSPSFALRADALPHLPKPTYCFPSKLVSSRQENHTNKALALHPSPIENWNSCTLPSILLPSNDRSDHHVNIATPRNGLSPFGPHISKSASIWTCEGISSGTGDQDLSQANKFACHRSCFPIAPHHPTNDCKFGLRSTGKDLLQSDGDDGWSEVEASLNSVLDEDQLNGCFPDDVVLDAEGRREITRDALVHEMMRFSRVLRLETFLEIFKINTFDRLVEFIHCLLTFCSIQSDPVFGHMVIPKGHLYVPARKMTISPRASLHPLGFVSPKMPAGLSPTNKMSSPSNFAQPILAIKVLNTRIVRRVGPIKGGTPSTVRTPTMESSEHQRKLDKPWRVEKPHPPKIFHGAYSDFGKLRSSLQSRARQPVKFETLSSRNALYAN